MLEILVIAVFIWLMGKAIGLAFQLTWGVAKVIASILMAVALPLLVVCLLFVGGAVVLLPLGLIVAAVGILKVCV